jgi:hypothetical protein
VFASVGSATVYGVTSSFSDLIFILISYRHSVVIVAMVIMPMAVKTSFILKIFDLIYMSTNVVY